MGYAYIFDDENDFISGDPHQNDKDLQYRCPQMLNGDKYGLKSDIWSLGVIFYEIIYGRKPWKAQSISQYRKKLETQPLAIPYDCKFSPIIKEMLEISEIDRCEWDILYQSVGLVNDDKDVTQRISLMISLTNLGKQAQALEILEQEIDEFGEFPEDQFDGSEEINRWFLFGTLMLLLL